LETPESRVLLIFATNIIDKAIFIANSDVWYCGKCENENSSSFVSDNSK
jgi:hypothetical protein